MRKMIFLLPIFAMVSTFAWGGELYQFNGDTRCALKKFADKKWLAASPDEVAGGTYQIIPAKFGLSTFKVNGAWYSAKTECFVKPGSGSNSEVAASPAADGASLTKGKIYAEFRLFKPMMMGAAATRTGTTPAANVATKSVTDAYSPGIGFAARGGYRFSDRDSLFLDVSYFSGTQAGTQTNGTVSAKSTLSDKITSFNVGYHRLFADQGIIPFAAGSLGYSKLSSTYNFAFTTPVAVATSASAINLTLEGGALYPLSKSFSLLGSLSYTFLSFSTETVGETTSTVQYPVGSSLANSLSYSHLGINIGAQYSF